MAGAIGPGSIVQAVRESFDGSLTVGGLYVVTEIRNAGRDLECRCCGGMVAPVFVEGKPEIGSVVFRDEVGPFHRVGYCPCAFRPWPPEPPSELLEEQEPKEVIREGAL